MSEYCKTKAPEKFQELISNINNGASILAIGNLINSQGGGQKLELQAQENYKIMTHLLNLQYVE